MEHTMHDHELSCAYVGFCQVFPSLADYRRWISDDWDTAQVLFAVTLFLLESLLHKTRLTRFLYSEVALQHTSLSL